VPKRVLVVDDDPDFRLVARLAIGSQPGFVVVEEGRNAVEAVDLAAGCSPDLVLLDCTMPGADPLGALGDLRAAAPAAEIVLASGHSPADLRLAARVAGAVGFVGKDVPPRKLANDLGVVSHLVGAIREHVTGAAHDAGGLADPAGLLRRPLEGGAVAVHSTRLGPALTSVTEARRFVTSAVGVAGADLVDAVVLVTSEVVTNALVHASGEVSLVVRITAGGVRVEVSDRSAVALRQGVTGLLAESGRGLSIVDALASRWGIEPLAGGGKTVWFEIAGTPDAGAA
jgi:CheY-like chemotaxis protein